MSTLATSPPRRGRPSTGARERILAAALEVLKAEGYAGASIAKVAARAGESKALVSYHFGSRHGLVAAAGAELGESITAEVLGMIRTPETPEAVIRAVLDGVWRVMDADERVTRLYFDLTAISVVEPGIRAVMGEVRESWRQTVAGLLREAGVPGRGVRAAAVLVMAGVEGLALERIERGETPELARAKALFARSTAAAIAPE